ncbi:MAG: adenosylcobinamide-GDP ribazoletransferase [Sedimentitalea sp.]
MPKNDIALPSRVSLLWDVPVALVLLTRLPMPSLPDAAFANQARAAWAFPLAGLAIGTLSGALALGALWLGLPVGAAAGLMLGAGVVLSGAMHEDGLADTCDGFWGGFTPARRLEIMKDSAIGTYGVLALILSLGLRWVALAMLLPHGIAAPLAAAIVSRGCFAVLMTALPLARTTGLSHGVGAPGGVVSAVSVGLGIVLALMLTGPAILLPALGAAIVVGGLAAVALRKIGGQTGDVLGAAQQLGEITLLLGLCVSLSF